MKKLFLISIATLSCTTFLYAQQGMGVGNNNPQEMLDVSGAIKIGTDINNNTNAPAGGAGTVRFRAGQFEGWDGSAWVTLSGGGADTDWTVSGVNQYSGVTGNIGIGTTTPNFKLDVNGSARFNNGSFVNNGLASSPSISFSSDSNTGIYAPSADNLGFVTGGVEGFRVDENGNVGIGPANPDAKLDLVGTFRYTNGTQGVNKVLRSDGSGFATWVDPNTLISDDGDWTVSGNNQYSAVSGNVGIGTTTADAKLELYNAGGTTSMKITKDGTQSGELYFLNGNNGSQGTTLTLNSAEHFVVQNNIADKDIFFNINDGGVQTDLLFLDGGVSRVGILNAAPDYELDVSGDISIDNSLVHNDDDNTFLSFTPDRIQLFAGSVSSSRIDIQASDSEVAVNEAGLQWDFRAEGDTDPNLLFVDGSADNVGIGTAMPTAKLEVAGQVKITGGTPGLNKVLTSDASGLASWTNASALDIDNLGNHIATENVQLNDFYLSNDGGNEGIRIDNAGNVGIGTAAAQRKLHIESNLASGLNIPLLIRNASATNNTNSGSGIGFNNHNGSSDPKTIIYNERISDFGLGKLHFALNNTSDVSGATLADARMTIQSNGNVGIGTAGPISKLDVTGGNIALNDGQLRLRAGNDGNHFLSHLGGSFDGPLLQGLSTVAIKTGANGDASGVFLRNNRVGIGIANPTNGLLHVEGFRDVNFGYQYFNSGAGTGWCGGCTAPISIWAQHRVATSELNVFSDARIKDVIGVSDGNEDLNTLLALEVTDYTYKDKIGRGPSVFKKVVAQQIEEVYPIAVSKTTNFVPDIYQVATINDGILSLPTVQVNAGERLKLILENGSEEMVTVEASSEHGVQTSSTLSGKVFVYGREVHDFRTVDYESLSMLNLSATQELFRMIKKLEDENAALRADVQDFKVMAEDIEKLKQWTNFEQRSKK